MYSIDDAFEQIEVLRRLSDACSDDDHVPPPLYEARRDSRFGRFIRRDRTMGGHPSAITHVRQRLLDTTGDRVRCDAGGDCGIIRINEFGGDPNLQYGNYVCLLATVVEACLSLIVAEDTFLSSGPTLLAKSAVRR